MTDKARLLVNADDFGLHRDINRGILDCIDRGRVQSISFSAIGRDTDWDKVAELMRNGIRAGLHVTLVGEPWATDSRLFNNWKELLRQIWYAGAPIKKAIEAEVRRQFEICAENGIEPRKLAHVDSHQHVHMIGCIWRPCVEQARTYGIARVRVPWAPTFGTMKKGLAGFALQAMARRRGREVKALPCLGLAQAGCNTVGVLRGELESAADAGRPDVELVAHPGVGTPALESRYPSWHFQWSTERDALLSPEFAQAVAENGYAFAAPS